MYESLHVAVKMHMNSRSFVTFYLCVIKYKSIR